MLLRIYVASFDLFYKDSISKQEVLIGQKLILIL